MEEDNSFFQSKAKRSVAYFRYSPSDPTLSAEDDSAEDRHWLTTMLKSKDTLFNAITISFLFCSFTITMVVSDLGLVLGVVGATGLTMVCYILPGIVYIKLYPKPHFVK